MIAIRCLVVGWLSCVWIQQAMAEEALPDPLTFDYALQQAQDLNHHILISAQANVVRAESELSSALAPTSLNASLILRAAYIEPSEFSLDQDNDDHLARLSVSKQLYDFGQTDLKVESANATLESSRSYMDYLIGLRQLDIARRYFEVILADLRYAWDNEAMAIAYVNFDKAQDRHALNQISDVALLEAENDYQAVRLQRNMSENTQRSSRALLAEVMNKPGALPSQLQRPQLTYHQQEVPEFEQLLKQAMQDNPQLKHLTVLAEAAQKRMQAARHQQRPTLNAELEMSEYSRDSGSNDDLRASLNLTIPLLENDAMKSQVALYRSQWLSNRAALLETQSRVRQRVLELWQAIRLAKTRREQVTVMQDYRELSLDRSRALYEMEATTDLGDAMVAISEVRYRQAEADFQLALAWMELKLLLGQNVYEKF